MYEKNDVDDKSKANNVICLKCEVWVTPASVRCIEKCDK